MLAIGLKIHVLECVLIRDFLSGGAPKFGEDEQAIRMAFYHPSQKQNPITLELAQACGQMFWLMHFKIENNHQLHLSRDGASETVVGSLSIAKSWSNNSALLKLLCRCRDSKRWTKKSTLSGSKLNFVSLAFTIILGAKAGDVGEIDNWLRFEVTVGCCGGEKVVFGNIDGEDTEFCEEIIGLQCICSANFELVPPEDACGRGVWL